MTLFWTDHAVKNTILAILSWAYLEFFLVTAHISHTTASTVAVLPLLKIEKPVISAQKSASLYLEL